MPREEKCIVKVLAFIWIFLLLCCNGLWNDADDDDAGETKKNKKLMMRIYCNTSKPERGKGIYDSSYVFFLLKSLARGKSHEMEGSRKRGLKEECRNISGKTDRCSMNFLGRTTTV